MQMTYSKESIHLRMSCFHCLGKWQLARWQKLFQMTILNHFLKSFSNRSRIIYPGNDVASVYLDVAKKVSCVTWYGFAHVWFVQLAVKSRLTFVFPPPIDSKKAHFLLCKWMFVEGLIAWLKMFPFYFLLLFLRAWNIWCLWMVIFYWC